MPQSTLNRLLIIPAIMLAATMSLTGCANLPFFGGDNNSSNNSSNNRDDDDDEDDDEDDEDDEDEESEDEDYDNSSSCPAGFVDAAMGTNFTDATITVEELTPSEFEPSELSEFLGGGCLFVMQSELDGETSSTYQAFVSGSADLVDEMGEALGESGYDGKDGAFTAEGEGTVLIFANPDFGASVDELVAFLGDEWVYISTYPAAN